MYQYSTYEPLASSKAYFDHLHGCVSHLKEVVKITNKFRRSANKPLLDKEDIKKGQRLLKLNFLKNKKLNTIIGDTKSIDTSNLEEKKYERS